MAGENTEIARRALQAFGSEISDAWHPNVEIVNAAGWVIETTYHGHAGLRRWWEDIAEAFEEGVHLELDEVEQIDDQRVLTTQNLRGTFRATGIPFDGPWASILTVSEGRIVRAEGFLSKKRALRAAGLPVS